MNGTEAYNKKYEELALNKLKKNADKQFLEGFYYYLLSDTSYSASYGYLTNVVKFINEMKIKNPEKIKLDHYTKYMSSIKSKTASYRIMVYSALKKFSGFLKANGYSEDYMQFIKRPKFSETQETKEKRDKGYMTKEEISIFLDSIKNSNKKEEWKSRDYTIAMVFLNSGIRCSALQKLDIDDVDFSEKSITVLEKGGISRKIFLSSKVVDCIERWVVYRDSILSGKSEMALFVSDRKKRMCAREIYNIIKKYGSGIEGKNITPHKTRGTYGTQLYDKTHDIYFVQQCMGHSNPKTTEMYIRGQKQNTSKRAADIMNDLI